MITREGFEYLRHADEERAKEAKAWRETTGAEWAAWVWEVRV